MALIDYSLHYSVNNDIVLLLLSGLRPDPGSVLLIESTVYTGLSGRSGRLSSGRKIAYSFCIGSLLSDVKG